MLQLRSLAARRPQLLQLRRCFSSPGGDDAHPASAVDAAYRLVLGVDADAAIHITPEQTLAVASALNGFSIFLHLPTGAGKSLAFQVPALLAPAGTTTLVVSPLIALMHDQVTNLKRKGVDAIHVSADTTRPTQRQRRSLHELLASRRLVYTTPEFLMQNRDMHEWLRALQDRRGLSRIVLDEAHCVLDWGNSFRPSYLELCRWKARHFRDVPLTLATATVLENDIPRLAELFRTELLLPTDPTFNGRHSTSASRATQMRLIQHIADRPNLRLEVVAKNDTLAPKLIQRRVGNAPTIVYSLTRREADALCLELIRLGCRAGVYHGGISRKRREFVRKQWMGSQISLICATSAFGMGIDRADVRFVVHHSLPLSLASYYQQIGRAGRDAKAATCLLLYSADDKSRAHWISTERVDESDGSPLLSGSSHVDVEEVASFCETAACRRAYLAGHFGHTAAVPCERNCNCGPMVEPLVDWTTEDDGAESAVATARSNDRGDDDDGDAEPSVATVEYYYQKVLAEARRHKLPKREALLRRTIREILRTEPETIEELAALRGVGQQKAERYFYTFSFR